MEQSAIQHIDSRPDVCGGKPCIAGTRIRVEDVYVWHELQRRSPDEIVSSFPHLTLGDVHAALAYYWDHRDQIQQQMQESDALVERMKQKNSSPLLEKLAARDAQNHSVPPG